MKIAIYFFGLFLTWAVQEPSLCKCNSSESLESEVQESELVAVGEVLQKNVISKNLNNEEGKLVIVGYKIRLEKSYKGVNKDREIYIYTTSQSASCGIQLEANKKYVLFGDKGTFLPDRFESSLSDKERLSYWVNHCSKTQEHSQKLEEEIQKIIIEQK